MHKTNLSEEDIFIIDTIARYTFLVKSEKEGIINKERYNELFEKFSPVQTIIIGEYLISVTKITTEISLNILNKNKS